MASKFYVPILKWKRGEQIALQNISSTTLNRLLPLIEIPPIEWDWNNDCPKKTIDEHISDVPNTLTKSLNGTPSFIDITQIEDEDLLLDGSHSIEFIIKEGTNQGLNLIPVVKVSMTTDYENAIHNLLKNKLVSNICIRIFPKDFNTLSNDLHSILNSFNLTPDNCHLIIDLQEIQQSSLGTYKYALPILINNIYSLNDWITITLASTSFPKDLSDISRNAHKLIPRLEYILWNDIINSVNTFIQFGDYCIANPEYSDADPRLLNMSGNLRYTIDKDFLVYKGVSVKKFKYSQMVNICSQLIKSGHYLGSSFSWGDKYIEDCANENASTGNAETWRRVGTNHHIQFIVSQLSTRSYF